MDEKKLTFLRSEEIASGTSQFHFSRPPGFDYVSGQTIDLYLIDPKEMDAEGPVRTFSLTSAPYEAELSIATRMRDTAFKRILKNAQAGTELTWDGPYGSFTLHKNGAKPAIFLAGGIGITPFMSIIKTAMHDNLPHELYLFHSNNTPEDAPFLNVLGDFSKKHSKLHYVPTMTSMERSSKPWEGERGFITKAMLEKHVSDLSTPIFYLAGPGGFVTAMRQMLAQSGVDEDNIRSEEFPGY